MDELEKMLLMQVADLHKVPDGAYNIRKNGGGDGRRSTEHIKIETKTEANRASIFLFSPTPKTKACIFPS